MYRDIVCSYSRTFNPNGRKFSNRANRTFLIGAVGIMIGVISFAFGLSALILAMMVQSTVNGLLGMKNTIDFSFYRCLRDYFYLICFLF